MTHIIKDKWLSKLLKKDSFRLIDIDKFETFKSNRTAGLILTVFMMLATLTKLF